MTYEDALARLLAEAGINPVGDDDLTVIADRLLTEGDRLGLYIAALVCPDLRGELCDEVTSAARLIVVRQAADAMRPLRTAMEDFARQVGEMVPAFREFGETLASVSPSFRSCPDPGRGEAIGMMTPEPHRGGPPIGPTLLRRLR